MNDDLGDRQKKYESAEAKRHLIPLLPAICRIDGRSFSGFTRGLEKPFDKRMSDAMIETTRFLVQDSGARCGYTQSDEITLMWYETDYKSQIYFNGCLQKMVSSIAASATLKFAMLVHDALGEDFYRRMPTFDARIWNVPNPTEAANNFLWRELDATKNAISCAARCYYSHSELQFKRGREMQELLFQKGVNFNDYPAFYKRGTFLQRRTITRRFDPDLDDLPEKHEARRNPDLEIERSEIRALDMPPFRKVINRVGVIFDGEDPVVLEE